jgi:hypothetical protein
MRKLMFLFLLFTAIQGGCTSNPYPQDLTGELEEMYALGDAKSIYFWASNQNTILQVTRAMHALAQKCDEGRGAQARVAMECYVSLFRRLCEGWSGDLGYRKERDGKPEMISQLLDKVLEREYADWEQNVGHVQTDGIFNEGLESMKAALKARKDRKRDRE